jgi:hypothetical protein
MVNLRTHQKFILYIFSHFENVSSIESANRTINESPTA